MGMGHQGNHFCNVWKILSWLSVYCINYKSQRERERVLNSLKRNSSLPFFISEVGIKTNTFPIWPASLVDGEGQRQSGPWERESCKSYQGGWREDRAWGVLLLGFDPRHHQSPEHHWVQPGDVSTFCYDLGDSHILGLLHGSSGQLAEYCSRDLPAWEHHLGAPLLTPSSPS